MKLTTELFDYGIQSDKSDLHIHVCVDAECFCVFRTQAALSAIQEHSYSQRPVMTNGILTANGYAVPIEHIVGLSVINMPKGYCNPQEFTGNQAERGKAAERYALNMMEVIFDGTVVTLRPVKDTLQQRDGVDIRANGLVAPVDLQVKCDKRGGPKDRGGTGNVYIQIAEINPKKSY